jgi:hypothetical protein
LGREEGGGELGENGKGLEDKKIEKSIRHELSI